MATTNKIIPSSTVSTSVGVRRWVLRIVIALAVIITLAIIASMVHKHNAQKQTEKKTMSLAPARALPQDAPNLPRAWNADGSMTDTSKWPRVKVPPNGDSVRVPSIFGGHIVWGGSGFKVHYVYSDGHECVIGDKSSSCGDGDIVSGYAHNDGDIEIYASYAYANQGEK